MAEIQIKKRYKSAGNVFNALLGIGFDPETASSFLNDINDADVVEVRHGEWKQATEPCGWHDVDCVVCSACGESWILDGDFDFDVVKDFWNYCPNCGAKMDGERKEQT